MNNKFDRPSVLTLVQRRQATAFQMGLPLIFLVSAILAGCAGMDTREGTGAYGVSDQRLRQLSAQIADDVQKGVIPGAVILVARNGKIVYTDAIGQQDPNSGVPMKQDAIFRIASMTKPIVSVATMMLVEEGKVLLSDPVSKYLPEFKGMRVGVEKKDASGNAVLEEVAADREMTVRDLLRQTSGLTYGFLGKSLVKQRYLDAKIETDLTPTLAEYLARVAKLPLAYQPGTTWEYSASTTILGAIVERVSGQTLDVFLSERILKPIGMKDSGFWVETAKQGRIAEPTATESKRNIWNVVSVRSPPQFGRGDSGMVSTAIDYYRFLQMLLNGGKLDGVQILSRKSVELMTSDFLGTSMAHAPIYLPGPGYGFGLGFTVRTAPGESANLGSVGDYGWGGIFGTLFFVDPKERLIGIYMIQQTDANAARSRFRTGVYSALE